MGATTTPNGHSSTILNMNNFSAASNSSSMNNNHSQFSHKSDGRLAKSNSVAPMSDNVAIVNEKEPHGMPNPDENALFVKRSDMEATENGSNTHLLNHNSETMNV